MTVLVSNHPDEQEGLIFPIFGKLSFCPDHEPLYNVTSYVHEVCFFVHESMFDQIYPDATDDDKDYYNRCDIVNDILWQMLIHHILFQKETLCLVITL